MTSRLGLNIHMQTPGLDRHALTQRLLVLNPSILVIMDDRSYAIDIKRRLPDCYVIDRSNFPGGVMDGIDRNIAPEIALAHYVNPIVDNNGQVVHPSLIGTDVAGYFNNESNWTPAHIAWELRVAQLAYEAGLPVCLGNWAVGQPEPELFDSGALDELLRWCSDPAHNATIGLHEGGFNQMSPLEGWDDAAQFGWLTGRFRLWINRCDVLGITPPMFAFTEFTMDGPGIGLRGVGAYLDYWRGAGVPDADAHLFSLIAETWRRIYAPVAQHIYGLAWYCAGHVTPDWIPYDILTQAPRVLDMAAVHTWEGGAVDVPDTPDIPDEEEPMPTGTQVTLTHEYENGLNFRSTPSIANNIMATLGSGVQVYTDYVTHSADGYDWLKVRRGTLEGWIAYDGRFDHHVTIDPPIPGNSNNEVVEILRVAMSAIQDAIDTIRALE